MSPFRSGRPLRPWLVVNPGEGTAAPWASWLQPSSENNFPAAARLPRAAKSIRCQVLHCVRTATDSAASSPAGRFTTETQWRDLAPPERRHILANNGTFTAAKDAYTGPHRPLTHIEQPKRKKRE